MRVPLATAALATLAALVLCVPAEARCRAVRGAELRTEASRVREEVATKFARDSRFANHVTVSVDPRGCGALKLSGVVATSADIRDAGRLASSVQGVFVIYNLLEVPHPARRVASGDASLERATQPREVLAGVR